MTAQRQKGGVVVAHAGSLLEGTWVLAVPKCQETEMGAVKAVLREASLGSHRVQQVCNGRRRLPEKR